MRLKKRIALLGAILIVFGCLIIYRMADHILPQQEYSNRFLLRSGRRVGKPLNFKEQPDIPKATNSTIIHNKFDFYICHRPNNIAAGTINMADVYNEIPFDNIDGGVWKQGWKIQANPNKWTEKNKLRVFIVPHSHNDPGWLKTFEDYYTTETRQILGNMLKKLSTDPKKKFIWAEISFFSKWWDELSVFEQRKVKNLVQNGQLEIVTGGWVMNDEANTHYYSMLTQLTEGHMWIKSNLQVYPQNGWTIDPFGESPIMPYLLKQMGLDNLVIQRVHYSIKKHFAEKQFLEFRWRQMWDDQGTHDLFTHMTPFYSYDIPHTCGPDPKVCCQFDFKRLAGGGVSCPWGEPPRVINKLNVAVRAQMLLQQYQMKAELYKTNVLLVPLGDDFRYQTNMEWDGQFENYYKIINYINTNRHLHAEVNFGTLKDYFKALREEMPVKSFPTVVGDFFTYADRDDHYWSGYYTSRPFYKKMDRLLISYHRAAEIIFSLGWGLEPMTVSNWLLLPQTGFSKMLRDARRNLGLFQHHDGITGTARDNVMEDYASKMLESINNCKHIIQQVTHYLLTPSNVTYLPDTELNYFDFDEHKKNLYFGLEKRVIILAEGESKSVVFFNSLAYTRTELATVLVFSPYVQVVDSFGKVVECQISPFFSHDVIMDDSSFEVSFLVEIPAMGLATYKISLKKKEDQIRDDTFSRVKIFNSQGTVKPSRGFDDYEKVDGGNVYIDNQFTSVVFGKNGLLKSITNKQIMETVPVHLDFIKYLARPGKERSGAYLFLPDGEATIVQDDSPLIRVVEGPLFSKVFVKMPLVKHILTLYNNPELRDLGLEIVNVVNITSQSNFELAMRISTHIRNQNVFFTDLNGFQIIQRKRLEKLPIQANYYPMPSASYIQDDNRRLTILSSQPLGVSSLKEGQLEIMQDRRLNQDDNRGLGQGVLDNKVTPNTFRILLEKRRENCQIVSSLLSSNAYFSSQSLLYPLMKMIWRPDTPSDLLTSYAPVDIELSHDVHLVSVRTFDEEEGGEETKPSVGMVFHRTHVDLCFVGSKPHGQGFVNMNTFLPKHFGEVMKRTSLSFLKKHEEMKKYHDQLLCHMEFLAVVLS